MTAADDQISILQTKLFLVPLSEDHVQRPHLLERLQQIKRHPLTVVSAPAGYGKSVLLSSWSQRCDCHSAWLSLDDEDNDLGSFEIYFLAGLNRLIPSFGDELMAMVGGARLPPTPVLVNMIFDELDLLEDDIVLIIDDYGVIANEDVHSLIAELMKHPHPRLHLVLGTRHDPPLPLNDWRAREQLLEFRSVDLRFSLEETRTFLQRTTDVLLDEEAIVAEYEQHFSFKMADGYSEEEIAARLGDPLSLGKQFDSETNKTATGNKAIVAIGLVVADIIITMLFFLLFIWVIVMGAATVALAVAGVCMIFNLNISNFLPSMPYFVALIFAVSSFALAVLAAVGTVYFWLYARQLLRSYCRWHRNTLATAGGEAKLPSIPAQPQISTDKNRSMRKIAIIALTVFVITFQVGYIAAALTAGALEFWHVWGWF